MGLTRQLLELFAEYRHPLAIVTKSALIERDRDLLADLTADNLVHVLVSVTTLDRNLARRMEPRAASPQRRLCIIETLAGSNIPVGLLASPIIPMLNDQEWESVMSAARGAGCRSAGYILLRLPLEISDLFEEWLNAHYPDKATRVMARIRDTRAGKTYRSQWGERMRGSGEYASLIAKRFHLAHKKLGYRDLAPLDTSLFSAPFSHSRQTRLF